MKGNTTMSLSGKSGNTNAVGLASPSLKNFGMLTMAHTEKGALSRKLKA